MTRPRFSSLRAWLQLVRAPNLFTVPGDPLVGYLMAAFGAVEAGIFKAIAASLCFYAGGLLLNDLADLKEDREERPKRPLPSGAAQPRAAFAVMLLLFLMGLVYCGELGTWPFGVGGALVAAIVAYNLYTKRLPVIGALNMGLCRGLSLLLGATAVPHGDLSIPLMFHGRLDHLAIGFFTLTFYIAAVTNLARYETKNAAPGFAKWLPAAALLGGIINFLPFVGASNRFPTLSLFVLALFLSAKAGWDLLVDLKHPLPPTIGQLIRLLLPLQAAYAAAAGDPVGSFCAAILILLWPISRAVGQRFYAS